MNRLAFFNPLGKTLEELPAIYGFNNGGSPGFYCGALIAEDGEYLGGHMCSHEGYIPGDLGLLEGHRPDRNETFREKYPDGYRMVYVPRDEVQTHPGLNAACKRSEERTKANGEAA